MIAKRVLLSVSLIAVFFGSDLMAYSCSVKKSSCSQMSGCEEARFYFERCGISSLDENGNGIPCDDLCSGSGEEIKNLFSGVGESGEDDAGSGYLYVPKKKKAAESGKKSSKVKNVADSGPAKNAESVLRKKKPEDPLEQFEMILNKLSKQDELKEQKKKKEEAKRRLAVKAKDLPYPVKAADINGQLHVFAVLPNTPSVASVSSVERIPASLLPRNAASGRRGVVPTGGRVSRASLRSIGGKLLSSAENPKLIELYKGQTFGAWIIVDLNNKMVKYKNRDTEAEKVIYY